ncbi:hypothetical protein [Qipengyuania vulgaris]|uniref:hypothetical protein n=1 Tax=Qipengyuania vulgaris TaxID=291985 RepID=UPI001F32EEDF|nr:hypothetical protein [Qipengyuania vulgaris]
MTDHAVIVGVGEFCDRPQAASGALEPVEMMARAARNASDDAGAHGILDHVDTVDLIGLVSWRYRDPAATRPHFGYKRASLGHHKSGPSATLTDGSQRRRLRGGLWSSQNLANVPWFSIGKRSHPNCPLIRLPQQA